MQELLNRGLSKEGDTYVFDNNIDISIAQQAGFDKCSDGRYTTKSPFIASKLYRFCNEGELPELDNLQKRYHESHQKDYDADFGEKFYSHFGVSLYKTPKEPKDFQKVGVKLIVESSVTLLGDEPGLGKTAQAIMGAEIYMEIKKLQRCIIVCPASLKDNWANEILKWGNPKFFDIQEREITVKTKKGKISLKSKHNAKTQVISSSKDEIDPVARFIIVNYDILSKEKIFSQICKLSFGFVICDEAHYLKNINANRTKAVFHPHSVLRHSRRVVFITGTPMVNRPSELYPVLRKTAPKTIDNMDYFEYTSKFCNGHRSRFGWDDKGASNIHELNFRLRSTIMLRRRKVDVLKELPPRYVNVVVLEQTKESLNIIATHKQVFEAEIDRLNGKTISVNISEMSEIRKKLASEKLKVCTPILEDAIEEQGKIVIFAYHKDIIKQIEEIFSKQKFVTITGETPVHKRQELVNQFQEDPDTKILIGNIQAAGVGFTLTAAHSVYFIETTWTPGELEQAIDRCHRIGQQETVTGYVFVIKDSLEAQIVEMIIEKQEVIKRVLDYQEQPTIMPDRLQRRLDRLEQSVSFLDGII